MLYRLEAICVFLIGLGLFTLGLSQQEIIGFETRFYFFILEMWRHGTTSFPTLYHHPYPDYPASGIILSYWASLLLGELNKLTVIFPSAVAAALTLMLTYSIGALQNRQWGYGAVCFLLLTNIFIIEARSISLDQYVTVVTAASFYLVYSAKVLQKPARIKWLAGLFILGFAFRGPIGLLIPAAVAGGFYVIERNYKNILWVIFSATLAFGVASIIWLSAAYYFGGAQFMLQVLTAEMIGRIQDVKAEPFYFYWLECLGSFAITYPLAILLLGCLRRKLFLQTNEMQLLRHLIAWVCIILIGLSIPADKKSRYVLAIAPAFALINAYLFAVKSHFFTGGMLKLRHMVYWFCYFLPTICFFSLAILIFYKPSLNYSLTLMNLAILQMILIGYCLYRQTYKLELTALTVAAATFMVINIGLIEPINLDLNRTRVFVHHIEDVRHQQQAQLVFYRGGTDGSAIKYLINMPNEETPLFINQPEELLKFGQKTFFITDADYFSRLSPNLVKTITIVARGKVGHDPFVVFKPISKSASHL